MSRFSANSPEVRKYFKFLALLLLALNGVAAIISSIPMMVYGTGREVGLSMDYLANTPFDSYRLPGILLFVVNGLGSCLAFIALYFDFRHHAYTVRAVGTILLAGIVMQTIFFRFIDPLHILFILISIALIVIGNYLKRFE